MYTLYNKIVADLKDARYKREDMKRNVLTTLLGELDTNAKRTCRHPTNETVIATVKKFVENAKFTMSKLDPSVELYKAYSQEVELLSAYMPKQMSEDELAGAVLAIVGEGFATIGEVMAQLKLRYPGMYDGRTATTVAKKYV